MRIDISVRGVDVGDIVHWEAEVNKFRRESRNAKISYRLGDDWEGEIE